MKDVEVITATFNLDQIRSYKAGISSRNIQASQSTSFPRIKLDIYLSTPFIDNTKLITDPIQVSYLSPEQEICNGPACWLWDYLVRSKSAGFFLPLSGGIDSCSTALIVFSMCKLVVLGVSKGDSGVLESVRRVVWDDTYTPIDPKEFCR